jgi:hypothetical protein
MSAVPSIALQKLGCVLLGWIGLGLRANSSVSSEAGESSIRQKMMFGR